MAPYAAATDGPLADMDCAAVFAYVGFRIFTVWLDNNTRKRVFAAALFHSAAKLAYLLFPVNKSYINVLLGALVMAGVAVVVVAVCGPKPLRVALMFVYDPIHSSKISTP